jgi:hypothetical protein|eukprot:evm.model.NODE_36902_length_5287_cov_28.509741.1
MDNSIVLNAAGSVLTSSESGFFVAPVRERTGTANLGYDMVTKEIFVVEADDRLLQEAKELKADRETDAIRIEALEKKVDTLILELQQLVVGPAK